jgi:hypothetical protein
MDSHIQPLRLFCNSPLQPLTPTKVGAQSFVSTREVARWNTALGPGLRRDERVLGAFRNKKQRSGCVHAIAAEARVSERWAVVEGERSAIAAISGVRGANR